MVAHSTLTGSDLHEPKGAASASTGQVYVADGSGSGSWKKITDAEINTGAFNYVTDSDLALSIRRGSGAPEGIVTAPVGTLYLRTDGGTGTTLYVKESGVGTVGWVAI